MSPGTALRRLELQAFHFAKVRSPDLGVHPAIRLESQWHLVSWMPAEGLVQLSRAEGRGATHAPSALGCPVLQRSPLLATLACLSANGSTKPSLPGSRCCGDHRTQDTQDKTRALSTMADKEPGRQGPSKEGVPAEMGPRGAQDRPLEPS